MSHFGHENYLSLWLWIRSKEFLKILQSERSREVNESYMNGFSKKNSFWTIGPFWHEKLRILATLDML